MRVLMMVVVAVAMTCATWLLGWWGVPLVAALAGLARMRPLAVGAMAALAWLALLVLDATHGGFGALAHVLGGVMMLPWLVVAAVALLLAFALAWGAATVTNQLRAAMSHDDAVPAA